MANKIQITGNVVYPFELKFTEAGTARLSGRIADTPRRFNRDTQQWEDAGETLFVDVTMWGDDAEDAADATVERKGRVTVTGTAGIRKYTTREGEDRTSFTVRADSIMMHASKNRDNNNFGGQQTGGQSLQADNNPWGGQPDSSANNPNPPF